MKDSLLIHDTLKAVTNKMYRISLCADPYRVPWNNLRNEFRKKYETVKYNQMLEEINAIDDPRSQEDIFFISKEDALAFVLKWS